MKVESFTGQYRWLSNFWPSSVLLDGRYYATVEHAYQAAKTVDSTERSTVALADSPGRAKARGRKVTLRADWDLVKLRIMEELLVQKFATEPLSTLLLATGDAELIEGNTWGDRFWGVCRGDGANHLGRLLMKIRAELRG